MEVRFSDNVKLVVDITDKMVSDYQTCRKHTEDERPFETLCSSCSLHVDIGDFLLCELQAVTEQMKRRGTELVE